MTQQFWVKTGKGVAGPFSSQQLREFAMKGKRKQHYHVSTDRTKWVVAGDVKGLGFNDENVSIGVEPRVKTEEKGTDMAARAIDDQVCEWLGEAPAQPSREKENRAITPAESSPSSFVEMNGQVDTPKAGRSGLPKWTAAARPDGDAVAESVRSLMRIMASIFPHKLHEVPEALENLRREIAQIRPEYRAGVVRGLQEIEAGHFGLLDQGVSDENWAVCMCMLGPEAAPCIPRVWSIAKQCQARPQDLSSLCEAICLRSESLSAVLPDVITVFGEMVAELPSRFASCTNEQSRYAVGGEIPCALVRLLGHGGPAAKAAIPALRKYRRFLFGKSFVQPQMTVLDFESGQVIPPAEEPRVQVRRALRAIRGERGVFSFFSRFRSVRRFRLAAIFAVSILVVALIGSLNWLHLAAIPNGPVYGGRSFSVIQRQEGTEYTLDGYTEFIESRSQAFSPSAVLVVGLEQGATLGGSNFAYGSVVLVEGPSGDPTFRLAKPSGMIILSRDVQVLGKRYPKGRLLIPDSGNLGSLSPDGSRAGAATLPVTEQHASLPAAPVEYRGHFRSISGTIKDGTLEDIFIVLERESLTPADVPMYFGCYTKDLPRQTSQAPFATYRGLKGIPAGSRKKKVGEFPSKEVDVLVLKFPELVFETCPVR